MGSPTVDLLLRARCDSVMEKQIAWKPGMEYLIAGMSRMDSGFVPLLDLIQHSVMMRTSAVVPMKRESCMFFDFVEEAEVDRLFTLFSLACLNSLLTFLV